MNIFVTNISRKVNDEALKTLFASFGEVSSAKIINDKFTGESRGFGFVEMTNDDEALDAIAKLTNTEFFGRELVVSKAKPRAASY